MRLLFLLFVIVPVLEMWLLIEVGSIIGAWKTITLVLLTAVIGAALLRSQGLDTLFRANQRLSSGQLPASELIEGIMLAVGGALLLTPGFVTDTIGFVCLVPITRRFLANYMLQSGSLHVMGSQSRDNIDSGDTLFRRHDSQRGHSKSSQSTQRHTSADSGNTIDGEYTREDIGK